MNKEKLKSLISYYKPFKLLFAADIGCSLVEALISIVIPLIVRRITTEIIYREPAAAVSGLVGAGALSLLLLLLQAACCYFVIHYGHMMGARMETQMRENIFRHYQKLSFSFFDEQKVGQLMSRVTSDLFEITELLHHGPEVLITCSVNLIGSLIVLLTVNWRLALIAFAPIPFMIVFAIHYNKKMRTAFVRNRAKIADINATMEDSLSGVRVVKSFTNEEMETCKFAHANKGFLISKRDSYRYMAQYHTVLDTLTIFITIAVAIAGGAMLIYGIVDLSELLVFILYIGNFTAPIRQLVYITEQFQNGLSGYTRFSEIMAIEPEIVDAPDAIALENISGDIGFEDVTFHYNGGADIFEHLNLTVSAGDYVALVGTSGVGKTTICNLIPRFYDVSGGRVTVDGHDVRELTAKSLRRGIGMVQQDVYLFAGTVMENIRYGNPEASDEEVIAAAKLANAHEFIENLSHGYNTDIGQRGLKLSGGQKQRLSIARVFLKNPPILIFDEATSALDNESERIVQGSLEALAKNRTTFVIAHRLSTIHNAKRILVLTSEGVAEEGSHSELMSLNGQYAALYRAGTL